MSQTEAQIEFQQLVDRNNQAPQRDRHIHPEDRLGDQGEASLDDLDEEEQFRAQQVDADMRMPSGNGSHSANGVDSHGYKLPPASFDSGRATGVKGVIADARNYEHARKTSLMNRVRTVRHSVFGLGQVSNGSRPLDKKSEPSSEEEDDDDDEDEESFLAQWRESRRRELEDDARPGASLHTRRTSPSVRIYGRFDTVDALGYLDAIEKVGRETVVLVFVYDDEVCSAPTAAAAASCLSALLPLLVLLLTSASAQYQLPSRLPYGRSSLITLPSTLSRSTTKTLSLTMRPYRPS